MLGERGLQFSGAGAVEHEVDDSHDALAEPYLHGQRKPTGMGGARRAGGFCMPASIYRGSSHECLLTHRYGSLPRR